MWHIKLVCERPTHQQTYRAAIAITAKNSMIMHLIDIFGEIGIGIHYW